MFSLFKIKPDEFESFKKDIEHYCLSMNYHDMSLADEELLQLMWHMGNSYITPEARGTNVSDKLHFEIKRGLARRYSFELLIRGDESSYEQFVQVQRVGFRLLPDGFQQLSEEAKAFDVDTRAVIRVSCFLSISDRAKEVLKSNGHVLSNDSEDFLSELAIVLTEKPILFPITTLLTPNQLTLLQKAFWPTMHLRHMLYTEGGVTMTKTFSEGVLSSAFNACDFMVWKWRWLTNLFGFQGGPAAKYYDSDVHQLANMVIAELQKILVTPEYSYLDNYLLKRAELTGMSQSAELSLHEQLLLGHIIAYFNQVTLLTPDLGQAVLLGYCAFKGEHESADELASLYYAHSHDPKTMTPTYVPAIINTAYVIFKKTYAMDDGDAIKNATQFMCQFLKALYVLPRHQRISCMDLAKEANLKGILEYWASQHDAIQFNITEDFQMKADLLPTIDSRLSFS